MFDELVDAVLFGIAFGGDVHKSRMPTAEFSIAYMRSYFIFLFKIEERSDLVDFSLNGLLEVFLRKFLYTEMLVEDVSEQVVGLADRGIVFAYKNARETVLFTEIGDDSYIFI